MTTAFKIGDNLIYEGATLVDVAKVLHKINPDVFIYKDKISFLSNHPELKGNCTYIKVPEKTDTLFQLYTTLHRLPCGSIESQREKVIVFGYFQALSLLEQTDSDLHDWDE